jgi:hypothetical protein
VTPSHVEECGTQCTLCKVLVLWLHKPVSRIGMNVGNCKMAEFQSFRVLFYAALSPAAALLGIHSGDVFLVEYQEILSTF